MKLGKKIIRKQAKQHPTKWEILLKDKTICIIDKLLNGEAVSRYENNCNASNMGHIICEIRSIIGFSAIENYIIEGRRAEAYKLADDDNAKKRLLELKKEILKRSH